MRKPGRLCTARGPGMRTAMDKVTFTLDQNEKQDYYVLAECEIKGVSYILVTEEEEGDAEAMIFKNVAEDPDGESTYELVEDEEEMNRAAAALEALLEDVEIEL